jgi:hypothetical protein
MIATEIVGVKKQENTPARLLADMRGLARVGRRGQHEARAPSGRRDQNPAPPWALGRILNE